MTDEILFFEFDRFHLYPSKRQLLRAGEVLAIKPKEFTVLLALVINHGKLLSYQEIREVGWQNIHVQESNITQTIYKLRLVLGDDAEKQRLIETIPKRGYRFVGSVIEHRAASESVSNAIANPASKLVSAGSKTLRQSPIWITAKAWVAILITVIILVFGLVRLVVNEQPNIGNLTFVTEPLSGHQFIIRIDGQKFNPNSARVVVTGPGCRKFGACVVTNDAIKQFGKITDTRLEAVPLTLAPGAFSIFVQNGRFSPPSQEMTFTVRVEGIK